MEWQAVVLAVQIMLLAAGWLLFQRARGELSARAAETPVLAEVRALQKSVKQLIVELERAADRQSTRLEVGCADAAIMLAELEAAVLHTKAQSDRLIDRETAGSSEGHNSRKRNSVTSGNSILISDWTNELAIDHNDEAECLGSGGFGPDLTLAGRIDRIYALADDGESAATIARTTRLSEGEVDTVLRLRPHR